MSVNGELCTCLEYEVGIYNRRGTSRIGVVTSATSITWGRRLDDTAVATVVATVGGSADSACCELLGRARSWGHTLRISRCGEVAFEGPIQSLVYDFDKVTIQAADMSAWLGRRIQPEATYTGTIQSIADQVIRAAYGRDDPNELAFIQPVGAGGEITSRTYRANERYVLDVLRELGGQGADWTLAGRNFYLRNQGTPPRVMASLRDVDFTVAVQAVEIGQDTATAATARGNIPNDAPEGTEGPTAACGGTDPFFGLVEVLVQDDSIRDVATAAESACAVVDRGSRPPLAIAIPPGASLSPHAPIVLDDMIPGWAIDVQLTTLCRPVSRRLRLIEVTGSVDENGETVGLTLAPVEAAVTA